jgi:hypothetical protein
MVQDTVWYFGINQITLRLYETNLYFTPTSKIAVIYS